MLLPKAAPFSRCWHRSQGSQVTRAELAVMAARRRLSEADGMPGSVRKTALGCEKGLQNEGPLLDVLLDVLLYVLYLTRKRKELPGRCWLSPSRRKSLR